MLIKIFLFFLIPFIAAAQIDILKQLQNNPDIEIKLLADSTVEIYNKEKNLHFLKTIKEYPENENKPEADLIIELDTVNFAAYENLYKRWGSIPGVNPYYSKYISVDANGNEKNEIFVWYINYFQSTYNRVRIYEQDTDSIFLLNYEFSDTLNTIYDFGDITGDGLLDVMCRGYGVHFFKQSDNSSFINTLDFIYNPFPPVYQINNATFYDIDGDDTLEIIYYLFAGDGDSAWAYSNHVAKFNQQLNNYEIIYFHRPQPEHFTSGISTGDFDQDEKGNFGTGSIGGKFFIYEYMQGTEYKVEYTKELETYNAYLTTLTDDMDGNGKPEIWIGGDFSSIIYGGVTRLYAFEASAPGIYEQVYQIDIRGLFSAIDGKMNYADMDGDNINDLLVTNGGLVFKFNFSNGNYYMDYVIQPPVLDSIYTTQRLDGVDAADLDGDGIIELVFQFFLSKGWQESWEDRSVFLRKNHIVNVNDEDVNLLEEFNLFQNYPNPFNPETKIKFTLPSASELKITIYNMLGKEIKELINETRYSGEYEITWDGTDNYNNKVTSGIYFIKMEAGSFRKTIKSVLIK